MDNEEDLLTTNQYTNDVGQHSGYGMTDDLKRFKYRARVEKKHTLKTQNQNKNIEDEDLLKTNPVITEDGELKQLNNNRYHKMITTVININSIQRQIFDKSEVVPRNSETGLYTREVEDDEGNVVIQEYTAKMLNDEFSAGPNDYYEPYFRKNNGDIGVIKYKYRYPNEYKIYLPRSFTNVKDIRMVSSEIPNTLNTINKYNDLITIYIRDIDTQKRILLKTGKSQFNYLLFQLENGNYTLEELIKHMQNKTNDVIKDISVEEFTNLFLISVNKNTGKISIKINNPPGKNLEFHWRFWFKHDLESSLPITKYGNLWYILGFNRPYEITTTGDDKFVTEITNIFNFGVNPFIKDVVSNDRVEYHVLKPYRAPDLTPNKYIFLTIEGLQTVTNIQNPDVTNFKNLDIFAKVNLDVPLGETAFNSFVSNPKLFFETPLRKLDKLKIKWIDYSGIAVDFSLRNHSFSLEIIEYIDILESTNYSSQRGTIDRTYATKIKDMID